MLIRCYSAAAKQQPVSREISKNRNWTVFRDPAECNIGKSWKVIKNVQKSFLKGLIGHHLVYLMNLSKGQRAAIFHGKVNDYPQDPIYSLCSIFQCVYLLLAQIFIVNQGLTQRPPG